MKAISYAPRGTWPMALTGALLLLIPMFWLNYRFLDAGRHVDELLEGYYSVAGEWRIVNEELRSGDGPAPESRNRLSLLAADVRRFVNGPELVHLFRVTPLKNQSAELIEAFSRLAARLDTPGGPVELSALDEISGGFANLRLVINEYRRRLNAGLAFLIQSQVALILLLLILMLIVMEDRMRMKLGAEASLRIRDEVVLAQEQERHRIALDLHDDVAQELSWIRLSLESHRNDSSLVDVMDHLIVRVRDMSGHLRTPDFRSEFFNDAVGDLISALERRTGLKVRYLPGSICPGVHPEIYGHVYRILQECLNNTRKHAGECRAFIEIQEEGGTLYCEYRDEGSGFDPDDPKRQERLGFTGIRNRVMMMNGRMELESGPGSGMALRIRIPLGGAFCE